MYPLSDVYEKWGRGHHCFMTVDDKQTKKTVRLKPNDECRDAMSQHPHFVGLVTRQFREFAVFIKNRE